MVRAPNHCPRIMKNTISVVICLLFSLTACAQPNKPEKALTDLQQADLCFSQRKYDSAIYYYQHHLRTDSSQRTAVYLKSGMSAGLFGDFQQAITFYQQCIDSPGDSLEYLKARAHRKRFELIRNIRKFKPVAFSDAIYILDHEPENPDLYEQAYFLAVDSLLLGNLNYDEQNTSQLTNYTHTLLNMNRENPGVYVYAAFVGSQFHWRKSQLTWYLKKASLRCKQQNLLDGFHQEPLLLAYAKVYYDAGDYFHSCMWYKKAAMSGYNPDPVFQKAFCDIEAVNINGAMYMLNFNYIFSH